MSKPTVSLCGGRVYIVFPIDSENRQLSAMRVNGVWSAFESYTLQSNSTRPLDMDEDFSAAFDAIARKAGY